jgi:uncharacterized membrane protein
VTTVHFRKVGRGGGSVAELGRRRGLRNLVQLVFKRTAIFSFLSRHLCSSFNRDALTSVASFCRRCQSILYNGHKRHERLISAKGVTKCVSKY